MVRVSMEELKAAARCCMKRDYNKKSCSFNDYLKGFTFHEEDGFSLFIGKSEGFIEPVTKAKLRQCYDDGLNLFDAVRKFIVREPELEKRVRRIINPPEEEKNWILDSESFEICSKKMIEVIKNLETYDLSDEQQTGLKKFLVYLSEVDFYTGSITLTARQKWPEGNSDMISLALDKRTLTLTESYIARDAILTPTSGISYQKTYLRFEEEKEFEDSMWEGALEYEQQCEFSSHLSAFFDMLENKNLRIDDKLKKSRSITRDSMKIKNTKKK